MNRSEAPGPAAGWRAPSRSSRSVPGRGGVLRLHIAPREPCHGSQGIAEARLIRVSREALDDVDCLPRVSVCQDEGCEHMRLSLNVDCHGSALPRLDLFQHRQRDLTRVAKSGLGLPAALSSRPNLTDRLAAKLTGDPSLLIHLKSSVSARCRCSDRSRKAGANAGYLFRQSEIFAEFGKGEGRGFHC